ncbi:transposase [Candidatus Woesearchaeota archaeon]|nr:transposase [Candidatus Woesearchaeota archaeon]
MCIRKALTTTKKVADCEGAKRMIEQSSIQEVTLHADREYDFERTYQAYYEKNIQPNIRPRTYKTKENTHRLKGKTPAQAAQIELNLTRNRPPVTAIAHKQNLTPMSTLQFHVN